MTWLRFGEDRQYEKVRKHLRKTSSQQVAEWAMSSLWATQQGLDGYQVTGDPAALEEARRGLVALLAATDVLADRAAGRNLT